MTLRDHNTINELINFYLKNRSEADYKKGIQPIDGHKIDKLMMANHLIGAELDPNIY